MAQTQKGKDQHAGQSQDKSRQQQDDQVARRSTPGAGGAAHQQQDDVKKRQAYDQADEHSDESEQDKSQPRRSLP